MPAQEKSHRFQKAVLWRRTGEDRYNEPIVSPGEEIKVRWEKVSRQVLRADGTPIGVTVQITLGDDDVKEGDLMWPGSIEELPNPNAPALPDAHVYEVVTFDKIPDVKGRKFERTATLNPFRDTRPEEEEDQEG